MKIKKIVLLLGCLVALTGCTQSNIVSPTSTEEKIVEVAPGETKVVTVTATKEFTPDYNKYNNIVIDEEELNKNINNIYVGGRLYPVASQLEAKLDFDNAMIYITVVVKDGTSLEDASSYAMEAVKGVNDEIAAQDFNYAIGSDYTYGGVYQDNEITVTVFYESAYAAGEDPIHEQVIEKDEYTPIVIE